MPMYRCVHVVRDQLETNYADTEKLLLSCECDVTSKVLVREIRLRYFC